MGTLDSPIISNGHLQRLVLTTSRWADGTPDSEQSLSGADRTVRCAVRCAGYNSTYVLRALEFLEGKGYSPAQADPT
jgi:hypothetical protein